MPIYMCQHHMVPGTSTNNINPLFSELSQQIHTMYEKLPIITQLCHTVRSYFTSISNAWYLITVLNMNRITTFFFYISQDLKLMKKCPLLKFGI